MDTDQSTLPRLKLPPLEKPHRTTASFSVAGNAYDLLAHEAAAHGVTIGILARDYALQLIRLRKEDARIGEGTGDERELLHTQLARMERQLIATVTPMKDQLADLRAENVILRQLVSELLATYLRHTPVVPAELRAEYAASAEDRHAKVLKRVAQTIQDGGGVDSVLTAVQAANLGV